jgi:hypothetical protein
MNPKEKLDIGSNPVGGSSTGAATARAKDPGIRTFGEEKTTNDPGIRTFGEEKTTNLVNKVGDVASDIYSKVSENVDTAKSAAKDYYGAVGDYYDGLMNYSRDNPGKMLLISLSAGVLLGYMMKPKPRYQLLLNYLMRDGLNRLIDRVF